MGAIKDKTALSSDSSYNGYFSPSINSTTANNGVTGIQLGYNWLFDSYLVGVESDINFGSFTRSTCRGAVTTNTACGDSYYGTQYAQDNSKLLGTMRLRMGYQFDNFMPYVSAGAALAKINSTLRMDCPTGCGASDTNSLNSTSTNNLTKLGFTYGFGAEYLINQNWRLGADYLYFKLPSSLTSLTHEATYGTQVFTTSQQNTYNMFRLKLNYSF